MKSVVKLFAVLIICVLMVSSMSACTSKTESSSSLSEEPENNLTVTSYCVSDNITGEKLDLVKQSFNIENGSVINLKMSDSDNSFKVTEINETCVTFTADQKYVVDTEGDVDYNTEFTVPYGKMTALLAEFDDVSYYAEFVYGIAEEESPLEFEDTAFYEDADKGISVTLTAKSFDCDGDIGITVNYVAENKGSEAISWLGFDVAYLDETSAELNTAKIAFELQDSPLAAGETAEYSRTQFFDTASNVDSVKLDKLVIKTADEPKPKGDDEKYSKLFDFIDNTEYTDFANNCDTNTPELLIYRRAYEEDIEITDKDVMLSVISTLKELEIAEPSDIYVTDSEIALIFEMNDGAEYVFNFETDGYFCYNSKNYNVVNGKDLFSILKRQQASD